MVDNDDKDVIEFMTNSFAAELLMPKDNLEDCANKMTKNKTKELNYSMVVQLQHKYGVDYVAINF